MNFKGYEPARFADVAETPLGKRVWKFLTSEKSVHAMEVASELHQPAVAGIEQTLLDQFGVEVLPDRIKQMIGHMVRQIMEQLGYIVDRSDVRLNSVPFSKGTRYRRIDWFALHVFRCSSDPRELCFSDRRTTEGFPKAPKGGEWRYWSSFSTALRGRVAFDINAEKVSKEVRRNGFVRHYLKRTLRAPR